MRILPAVFGLIALILSAASAFADPDPQVIRLGKSATALVVLPGGRIAGSAFCIDPGGFFLTTAHVLAESTTRPATPPHLILNGGEENERTLPAAVVRLDKDLDLALLKADAADLPALEAGDASGLIETMQVVTFGYPLDDALSARDGRFPSVTVNVARITSLRKSKGQLQFIQLDTTLGAAHCGGPAIDARGAIIGIVASPLRGGSSNLVIPVGQLQAFLSRPHITFAPPTIPFARRHDEIELSLRILSFGKAKPKLSVEMILSSGKDDRRKFDATAGPAGTFTARVVPLPPRSSPTTMPVTINYPAGSIRCTVEDRGIEVDGRPMWLSQFKRIDRRDGKIFLIPREGEQIAAATLNIGSLKADFGGYITEIDPFKAQDLSIGEGQRERQRLGYTILVKQDATVVAESKGEIAIAPREPNPLPRNRPVPTTAPSAKGQ